MLSARDWELWQRGKNMEARKSEAFDLLITHPVSQHDVHLEPAALLAAIQQLAAPGIVIIKNV